MSTSVVIRLLSRRLRWLREDERKRAVAEIGECERSVDEDERKRSSVSEGNHVGVIKKGQARPDPTGHREISSWADAVRRVTMVDQLNIFEINL